MSVNYLEIVKALDCCTGLPADEDAEALCNNCPYAEKGCDESLILVDSTAFIVSVKNNTVITTISADDLKENVFTNIDSAVIV